MACNQTFSAENLKENFTKILMEIKVFFLHDSTSFENDIKPFMPLRRYRYYVWFLKTLSDSNTFVKFDVTWFSV